MIGVHNERAIVRAVEHLVVIIIPVTGIAVSIAIGIGLIGVRNERAIVRAVEHLVVIIVGVAGVAFIIVISVCLVRISGIGTVIRTIGFTIIIAIGNAARALAYSHDLVNDIIGPLIIRLLQRVICIFEGGHSAGKPNLANIRKFKIKGVTKTILGDQLVFSTHHESYLALTSFR